MVEMTAQDKNSRHPRPSPVDPQTSTRSAHPVVPHRPASTDLEPVRSFSFWSASRQDRLCKRYNRWW